VAALAVGLFWGYIVTLLISWMRPLRTCGRIGRKITCGWQLIRIASTPTQTWLSNVGKAWEWVHSRHLTEIQADPQKADPAIIQNYGELNQECAFE